MRIMQIFQTHLTDEFKNVFSVQVSYPAGYLPLASGNNYGYPSLVSDLSGSVDTI